MKDHLDVLFPTHQGSVGMGRASFSCSNRIGGLIRYTGRMNDQALVQTAIERLRNTAGGQRFLVVGDIMVDHYVYGDVERVSPEAPVPVLDVVRRRSCPGGAANVANNLIALGAQVTLLGRIGIDDDGQFILDTFLKRAALSVVVCKDYETERKTRYVTRDGQQLLRVDTINPPSASEHDHAALLRRLESALRVGVDGIVVADYDKGTLEYRLVATIQKHPVRCFLDCKPRSLPMYNKGCGNPMTLKPNQREFQAMGGWIEKDGTVQHLGQFPGNSRFGADELLVTRGRDGMTLVYDHLCQQEKLPVLAQEVYNVTGAGDTVLATYAYCRVRGMEPPQAALVANVAAAEVVKHHDTAVISHSDLLLAVERYACDIQSTVRTGSGA